jgi:SNF2 family DNA or RNA helicase
MSQAAMGLKAEMRIALTGTPLQNYLSELWNLFQFINPGLLGSYEAFSHDFIGPIESAHDKQRQVLLRQLLQPFLLRRTKAEVIDELPEKTEITRRVELSKEERVAYEAMRIEAQRQVESAEKVDVNVLASITRLRQAACSLELVDDGALSGGEGGSKLADFAELLTQIVTGGNRVLVFSQFTSFLKMAQSYSEAALQRSGLTATRSDSEAFLYLDGSTPLARRKKMVEAFQHGEAQVFFISLKAGGLGLNLTGANYVIHLDPWWNPAIEQQATDRAYRIGQKRNVTVYHLIAADTIEEKILRLHKTKRDLADALLHDQNTTHSLTLADLQQLLSSREEPGS